MAPDEDTQWWLRSLARKPASAEPEPEPDVAAMTAAEYEAHRAALNIPDGHDTDGSHWSDRRSAHVAAAHLASPRRPDEAIEDYLAERARAGISDAPSVAGADRTPGARRFPSPWRVT